MLQQSGNSGSDPSVAKHVTGRIDPSDFFDAPEDVASSRVPMA
jgi:hypothetical protein